MAANYDEFNTPDAKPENSLTIKYVNAFCLQIYILHCRLRKMERCQGIYCT